MLKAVLLNKSKTASFLNINAYLIKKLLTNFVNYNNI